MSSIKLNEAFKLNNGVILPNRIMKSATSEQLGDKKRNPKPDLATLYETWSLGGAGLLVTGNIMVDRTAIGEPFNVVLDEESDLFQFVRWTQLGTVKGNQLWAQLNHPGKQSPNVLSKVPVAPSAISLEGDIAKAFNTPKALSDDEINQIIKRFATSARLAKKVGFTGVQIHGAHGYLVNQFLSSRHNQRTDNWGGTLENRMKFVLDIYHAIRLEVGDNFPVAIKLNSADFQKGGFTEEESMQVVEALVQVGIDFIEISGGSYENPMMVTGDVQTASKSTRKREAYFLNYAEALRKRTDIPLAVTGGFRSSEGMMQAINSGATDIVGLARPMILKPDLPMAAFSDTKFVFNWNEPTTGFKKFDMMTMLTLIWYEKQMWRIGKGQAVKLKLSPWMASLTSIWKVLTSPPVKRRS
ncbi:NADH:flavin oxidoreductase/NADH oxidase family protein [Cognaticolwellia mytili]|uniref:NADH:flavin oxidoreductase/NADH oxidase family protein n=1 Tax=Cognaticolwellia mytili TaxID=1888913 RepID=UPI000A16FB2E|nr:NADH:flavin oxidoreductase/NADH oxidase family protein [Cognaticolwellia mytili]